jgi:hypothetical protein
MIRLSVACLVLALTAVLSAQSEPPKTPEKTNTTNRISAKSTQKPKSADKGNTQPDKPVLVSILEQQRTAAEKQKEEDERIAAIARESAQLEIARQQLRISGILAGFTALTLLVLIVQSCYNARAANAARDSVIEIQNSRDDATRSADAMQSVAASFAQSVSQVQDMLTKTATMADAQKESGDKIAKAWIAAAEHLGRVATTLEGQAETTKKWMDEMRPGWFEKQGKPETPES